MEIRVLGCSGGIAGNLRTTSFLVDGRILIDAGTGVGDLSLFELAQIDHVFITHAHLDHIAMLPLMLDSVGAMRPTPLKVYAEAATLFILQQHIFNNLIWPDFTRIPPKAPFMTLHPIVLGEVYQPLPGIAIRPLPAIHTVPAVGYQVQTALGSWVFGGDSTGGAAFWACVNRIDDLHYLIIETAFCNRERVLADLAKHLCPDTLAQELRAFNSHCEIFITHLKPGELELTMQEIALGAAPWSPKMLQHGHIFKL